MGVEETLEVQVARDPEGDRPQQRRVPEQVIAQDILESPQKRVLQRTAEQFVDPRVGHFVEQIADVLVLARSGTSSAAASTGCRTLSPREKEVRSRSGKLVRTCCRTRSRPRGSPMRLSVSCTTRIGGVPDPAPQPYCWWLAVADGSWEGTIVCRLLFGDWDGRMVTWFMDNAWRPTMQAFL